MTPPVHINWRAFATSSQDSTGASVPYCAGVAPPAELALLAGLSHLVRGAATTPYASQGLTPDTSLCPASYNWQWVQVVGPATYAARGVFVVSSDGVESTTPPDVSTWSYSSGASANDEIVIPSPLDQGGYESPPPFGRTTVSRAEMTHNTTPTAPSNRLYEMTATLRSGDEKFEGMHFNGCCIEVIQRGDLSSI